MKKFKLEIGDVFTIPIMADEVGFGQIISFPNTKDVFIMIIFDYKEANTVNVDLKFVCEQKIIFLGYSVDAKLFYKDWKIIGNYKNNIGDVKLPFYKIGISPDIYITNFKGEPLNEIDVDAFNQLSFKATIAPIRFENALKSYFGIGDWIEKDYDKLLYDYALFSNTVAQKYGSGIN